MGEDEEVPKFMSGMNIDGDATLSARVYRVETNREAQEVIRQAKRDYADEYNVEYSQLIGRLLDSEMYEKVVLVVKASWKNE